MPIRYIYTFGVHKVHFGTASENRNATLKLNKTIEIKLKAITKYIPTLKIEYLRNNLLNPRETGNYKSVLFFLWS